MIDLLTPTRGAFFRALNAGPAAQLAPVFTEVPEDTQPPFFRIGTIEHEDVSAKPDDQLEELTVEVVAIYRGEDRGVLLKMMHAATASLHRQPISAPGVAFRRPRFVVGTASDAASDGITYAGLTTFKLNAQPA